MQYKTIVLELIQDRPQLHDHLKKSRALLRTLETYASQLKDRHLAWKSFLLQGRPGSAAGQVSSVALELALEDLQAALRQDFSMDTRKPVSLDAAMAYLHRTPTE
jgi:hypothetical protein